MRLDPAAAAQARGPNHIVVRSAVHTNPLDPTGPGPHSAICNVQFSRAPLRVAAKRLPHRSGGRSLFAQALRGECFEEFLEVEGARRGDGHAEEATRVRVWFETEIIVAQRARQEGFQHRPAGRESFGRVGCKGAIIDKQLELPAAEPQRLRAVEVLFQKLASVNGGAQRLTEAVVQPLRRQFVESTSALFSSPSRVSPVMQNVAAGTDVAVLGSYEGFLYVQSPDGNNGWLAGKADL